MLRSYDVPTGLARYAAFLNNADVLLGFEQGPTRHSVYVELQRKMAGFSSKSSLGFVLPSIVTVLRTCVRIPPQGLKVSLIYISLFLFLYFLLLLLFCSRKKTLREDYVRLSVLLSPSISCQFFHNLLMPCILESNPHPNLIRTSVCRFLKRKNS
jgi:hypothetical protein